MTPELEKRIREAMLNPQNMGEMEGADSIGTVGNSECGEMLRMWVKFKEENGRRVIDRATFQTFGCQTAIAVAKKPMGRGEAIGRTTMRVTASASSSPPGAAGVAGAACSFPSICTRSSPRHARRHAIDDDGAVAVHRSSEPSRRHPRDCHCAPGRIRSR